MSMNKLSLVLGTMFATGCVFFGLLLKRSTEIRNELRTLADSRRVA
jgi:hypothetical protein